MQVRPGGLIQRGPADTLLHIVADEAHHEGWVQRITSKYTLN